MVDYVEKIKNYTIGGDILDNEWVFKYKDVVSGFNWENVTESTSHLDFSIEGYLPEVGNNYEILGWVALESDTIISNAHPILNICNSNNHLYNQFAPSTTTTSASYLGGGSFRLIITPNSSKNIIRLSNGRLQNIYNIYVRVVAYRKIGTNT